MAGTSDPFSLRERFETWSASVRGLWVAAVAVVVVVLVALGTQGGPLTMPGLYRTARPHPAEVVDLWCIDGQLMAPPPHAHCVRPGRGGEIHHAGQAQLEAFAQSLPGRWAVRPPHRYTLALLALILGAVVWWAVRPVEVQVDGHRVRIGNRTFSRFDIRGCRIAHSLRGPRLVIATDEGDWRSPPLHRRGWTLHQLAEQIHGLRASPSEVVNERIAAHRLRQELAPMRAAMERNAPLG